jgi:hypothetical protein
MTYCSCFRLLFYSPQLSYLLSYKVRSDLHAFGFRTDLSRCPEDARVYKNGNTKTYFDITERVVKDVSMMTSSDKCISCGHLAEYGLTSLHLYHIASFSSSSHLAEYILALTVLRHPNVINMIISEALKTLYLTQGNWSGNEVVQVIQMVSFIGKVSICCKIFFKVISFITTLQSRC